MRVLLVYDHLETGGTQTYGRGLSQALIRAGHEVAVASRGGSTASRFAQLGVRCLDWPAPKRTDISGLIRGVRQAGRLLAAWQPDVIHAHAGLPGLLFSIAARRSNGRRVPVVVGSQRSWRSLYRFPGGGLWSWCLYQLLRLSADEVVAVSEGLRQEFVRNGIPAARCHLIPNGIDLALFEAAESGAVSPAPGGARRIVGTLGRLVDQKGMDVFIEAAACVSAQAPDVQFWIVGEGPLRQRCRAHIDALDLADRVSLLGERSDVASLLAQMTVFVSASRWEGMPYALLEALAARRPVVATRVIGSADLITDGVHGRLVPPDDPAAMSAAIVDLLNDPGRAQMLGRAGRRWVETHYSLRVMADKITALYSRTIAEHRA
jgi:glycosyltransferase involved in cell wall biosynthesis